MTIHSIQNNKRDIGVKKSSYFIHEPLGGYQKAHFYSASFMKGNILNYWKSKQTDPLKEYLNKTSSLSKEETVEKFLGIPIKERSNRNKLTGECIIFKEYQNEIYFLTLGAHFENNEYIHKRILNYCQFEFPFLKKLFIYITKLRMDKWI